MTKANRALLSVVWHINLKRLHNITFINILSLCRCLVFVNKFWILSHPPTILNNPLSSHFFLNIPSIDTQKLSSSLISHPVVIVLSIFQPKGWNLKYMAKYIYCYNCEAIGVIKLSLWPCSDISMRIIFLIYISRFSVSPHNEFSHSFKQRLYFIILVLKRKNVGNQNI